MTGLLINQQTQSLSRWALITRWSLNQKRQCHHLTHYQVLGLKSDCNRREIRSAFIKLSKEYHPDGDPCDKTRHAKFILINEAYSVLIKRQTRMIYDEALRCGAFYGDTWSRSKHPNVNVGNFYSKRPGRAEDMFWNSSDRAEDYFYSSKPYYGIRGLKRLPNWNIAIGCCVCIILSSIAFIVATRRVAELRKEAIDKTNEANMAIYKAVKLRASENSLAQQINLLELSIQKRNSSNDD